MEEHAGAVHILHPQVDALVQTQAAEIDGGKTGAIAVQADLVEDTAHLLDTEDDRQFLFPLGPDKLDCVPFSHAGVVVEELDTAQGDSDGCAGVLFAMVR